MYFEIIGEIENVERIAIGASIRDIVRLRKRYETGRWRKLKGTALVRLRSGAIHRAEIHWYEAQGIGKVKFKIKQFLDQHIWRIRKNSLPFVFGTKALKI